MFGVARQTSQHCEYIPLSSKTSEGCILPARWRVKLCLFSPMLSVGRDIADVHFCCTFVWGIKNTAILREMTVHFALGALGATRTRDLLLRKQAL
jgi:hypothetical protein